MIRIRFYRSLLITSTIFILFPYTALLPSASYTQPYAIVFSSLAVLLNFRRILNEAPKGIFSRLLGLCLYGIVLFVFSSFPYTNSQDYKSLLAFISPLIFACIGYIAYKSHLYLLQNIVKVSALIWVLVSLIQVFYPGFATTFVGIWSEAGLINSLSGRGSMGLAPEPTHNGFHLIVMGMIVFLTNGSKNLSRICIVAAIILAKSASSLLVLSLSSLLFFVRRLSAFQIFIFILIASCYGFFKDLIVSIHWLSSNRIGTLVLGFLSNPSRILELDYSVNQRLGGIYIGFSESLSNWLIPQGISNNYWITDSNHFLSKYPWSMGISSAGIPSGYFNIIYQGGFLGVFYLIPIIRYVLKSKFSRYGMWLSTTFICVFLGQFMVSNPLFGFVIGLVASKREAADT